MPTLSSELRNKLERVVIEARDTAEVGARTALEALAVHHHEPYPHMTPDQRKLRNHLRARARQLGDRRLSKADSSGMDHEIAHLAGECAYEHWHRMLFARFLAENGLLIEPESGVAITLDEAEELAKEEGERRKEEGGKADVWDYVSRCAQRMLPQIFRPDDPLLQVSFATEHRIKLESLLASLPAEVFTASDALGWVYQFWQSKKKDQVNHSEVKIGADELPAVTQLFTEPYMVEFLLHNTLGAWWVGKRLKEQVERRKEEWEACQTEEECRRLLALPGVNWDYLRFVKAEQKPESETSAFRLSPSAFIPAAGTFDGWPRAAKEIKVLDPCCGSGHFLVAALHHLVPIRMAEEGLMASEAVDAVLRDNLHGLEIDERCCQIAAFALALAAWTYPDAGGYRPLPELHIACTGIGPQCSEEEWLKLAEKVDPSAFRLSPSAFALKNGLLNLHRLFSQAPTLGSLINPKELPADLIAADYETIQPYLTAILNAEKADDETRERAIAAAGMVKAADLLAGDYALIVTNVPYLARGKHCESLKDFIAMHHDDARQDLATAFLDRSLKFAQRGGTLGVVCPQNWLSLPAYSALRKRLLKTRRFEVMAKLGPGAFGTISGEVVNVALVGITAVAPPSEHRYGGVDASGVGGIPKKAEALAGGEWRTVAQRDALDGPDARITLEARGRVPTLGEYANSPQGIKTGDDGRFRRNWWEPPCFDRRWRPFQGTPEADGVAGGMRYALDWSDDGREFARLQGTAAWGKRGVVVKLMGDFSFSLYHGELFDSNVTAIVPRKDDLVEPVWAFCLSPTFREELSVLEDGIKVNNATVVKVPFDLAHWQKVAAEKYPDGLPEPESDDPTQWLFHGWPVVKLPAAGKEALQPLGEREAAIAALQVAVARLLGYRWPAEAEGERRKEEGGSEEGGMRLSKRARELVKRCEELLPFADEDGIVCIPSVRGEEPAAEQLRRLLAAAFGEKWSAEREQRLIRATGSTAADLDEWLRNDFFEQHCKLFHDRPFIWHIWDGRKRDGFHALVNYHRLAQKAEGGGRKEEGEKRKAEGHAGRRLLESLTYAYLGEWITRQKDGVKRGEGGAEDRLAAALELQQRLEAILEGEPPFDLFVRWKKLSEQPIGWEPDINDGVRLNIRPFLASDLPGGRTGAGILRCKPNIKWTKDRGKEPQRPREEYPWFWGWDEKTVDFAGGKTFDGNRWNDCHYTNSIKQQAREAVKKGGK